MENKTTIVNGVDLTKGIETLKKEGVIINCTSHPVNIVLEEEGKILTFMPSGTEPRCATEVKEIAPGFKATTYGEVENLPEIVEGKLLIVSALVRNRSGREDLIGPDTSPSGKVVDSEGVLIGVKGFTL